MAEQLNNLHLVNAPAGSGKTTRIKAMVQKILLDNPKDNILCITYTNRAADELSKDINSANIFIGTIHSFLHDFVKRYFAHQDILCLYFEVYGEKINDRIRNLDNEEHISESNYKYREKYGELSFEAIKKNIKAISYNESPFNSLYYGGLSHDDLISFSKQIFDRFPVIRKRISSKYQYVFIDEYQDTMADVLKMFYEAIFDTDSQLYLFGDRMQQIYKNYDGSFEEQFGNFDTSEALMTNYRSVSDVVELLNKIYNNAEYQQDNSAEMKHASSDFPPRVILSKNVEKSISELKEANSDPLVLYLFNKERFSAIGALNLYQAFDSMEKYSFGKTYSAVNILTTDYSDNPDPLMKLLFCIAEMYIDYQKCQYGLVVQNLKKYNKLFNKDSCHISSHAEKKALFDKLNEIFSSFADESHNIETLLAVLNKTSIINEYYLDGLRADEENQLAFESPTIEVLRMVEYVHNPKVSTQHGVKGESHDSVIFVADDSNRNPIVHMYKFFEVWTSTNITLQSFHEFYYAYVNALFELQNLIGTKISDLNKDSYTQHEKDISSKVGLILNQFQHNPYFEVLCKSQYNRFIEKPNVTNAKACLKESSVYGVLSAYKLFYVGCSRARKNLTILLDQNKIKGDVEQQKRKFLEIGFAIQ